MAETIGAGSVSLADAEIGTYAGHRRTVELAIGWLQYRTDEAASGAPIRDGNIAYPFDIVHK